MIKIPLRGTNKAQRPPISGHRHGGRGPGEGPGAARLLARVIVTMHVGAEGATARRTRDVVERFAGENRGNSVAFARAAVRGGASLVIGHGPHVLRATR